MKPSSPAIVRKWKRLMAVGCSHGNLADPAAIAAVLRFRDAWKPDTTVHLGDAIDTAALRSGAKGTSDESEPILPDLDDGLEFIEQLRPKIYFAGNHEDRVFKLVNSTNAVVAMCAGEILNRIKMKCDKLKCELVPWHFITGWRMLGNYRFGHGYLFSENATRDHAESVGNCVHAHTHRAGMAKGRRLDNPTGYSVGTLTNIPNMDYAKARRATLAWSAGFVWGEYTDDRAVIWLHEQPRTETTWKLPI